MAQKVQVAFIDDIDGSEAAGTVTFALEGQGYEIDLSVSHAQGLRDALAPWIAKARRARGGTGGGTARRPVARSRADLAAIRAWARDNGYQVSDRGRVAGEVLTAYDAAHGAQAA